MRAGFGQGWALPVWVRWLVDPARDWVLQSACQDVYYDVVEAQEPTLVHLLVAMEAESFGILDQEAGRQYYL